MTRMRMKMKMRMMTLYQLEISSPGGSNLGLPESFRVPISPAPCLFLAKARATSASTASFRGFSKNVQRPFFLNVCSLETCCANTISLKENGKTVQLGNYHDVLRESGGGTARKKSA